MSLSENYNKVMQVMADKKRVLVETHTCIVETLKELFGQTEDKAFEELTEDIQDDLLYRSVHFDVKNGPDASADVNIWLDASGQVRIDGVNEEIKLDVSALTPHEAAAKIVLVVAEDLAAPGWYDLAVTLSKAAEAYPAQTPASQSPALKLA